MFIIFLIPGSRAMDYQCTYKDIFEIIQGHFELSLDAKLEIFEE